MKKIVITFGLISGAISSLMMIGTMPFHEQIGFDKGMIIGYTTLVLSFMMVFFGVRSYRDNVAGGQISFGKAFQVGIFITLISCVCYVLTWQVLYRTVASDYGEKYSAYVLEKAKNAGASEAELQKQAAEMKKFWEMYQNPLVNVGFTFMEPLPVGLLITLISAAVLRTKGSASSNLARAAIS
jgi:hypothetical protein